ncbi:MAG: hypothetical protein IAG13_38610 [Deltaproteobacteria bacterium]|nr:hypothetical protein [Nannocystaceae bacterium]
MMRHSKPSAEKYVTAIYLILSFYCLGALVIENDVNYPSWQWIGDQEFPQFHRRLEQRLLVPFMAPLTLLLVANLAMVWFHLRGVPRYIVWLSAINCVYLLAESLLIQVPIHETLDHVKTNAVLEELHRTHLYYRLPSEVVLFVTAAAVLLESLPGKQPKSAS